MRSTLGWDYSSRWVKQPFLGNLTFNLPALRTLNVRNTTPVDLNSMLCGYIPFSCFRLDQFVYLTFIPLGYRQCENASRRSL